MMGLRKVFLAASVAAVAASPIPASAQIDGAIVLNILRECAKINDAGSRLACYDNNIRSSGAAPAASSALPPQTRNPSPQSQALAPSAAPAPASAIAPAQTQAQPAAPATGFGGETLRTTKAQVQAQREDGITATVSQVAEREPGTYLLTLEDGAQWVFSESVSRAYKVPARGSVIEIDRAALGSFTMRYNNQAVVRVRRVR